MHYYKSWSSPLPLDSDASSFRKGDKEEAEETARNEVQLANDQDRAMPIWEAVTLVLQQHGNGQAMRIRDVIRFVIGQRLVKLDSRTPKSSIHAIISMEKKREHPRLFSAKGFVALTEGALQTALDGQAALPGLVHEISKCPGESVGHEELASFLRALLSDFPQGFSFSPSSECLLSKAAGRDMTAGIRRILREKMFRRHDDTWLLPEMVAENSIVTSMVSCADRYLCDFGCFSLDVIKAEFRSLLRNLPDTDVDFKRFFMHVVAPEVSQAFELTCGKGSKFCYRSGQTEAQSYEYLTAKLYQVLRNAGDAVSLDFLCEKFPFLCANTIDSIIRKKIQTAISLTLEGMDYWKLLESFYLPDDIGEQVTQIVDRLDMEGHPISAMLIEKELDRLYGEEFRQNFGVQDINVFQQIVASVYQGPVKRTWKKSVFRRESEEGGNNILDDFLKNQTGSFNESEFFEYAERTRGLTQKGMLILSFLRTSCIRLNRNTWISAKHFCPRSSLSVKDLQTVASCLTELLGKDDFLPLGTLPPSFFDRLPPFALEDRNYHWNPYLLTSVCKHLIPSLRIVNDEPSPYTVTAMLIPTESNVAGDIIDYVLDVYMSSGMCRNTAADVFEYLRQKQVRMTKSKKLMARIRVKCGVI